MVYDIFEAYTDHYKGNKIEALNSLKDVADSIEYNPRKFAMKLHELILEESLELFICPNCGADLSCLELHEIHVELDGKPIETKEICICKLCGWKND